MTTFKTISASIAAATLLLVSASAMAVTSYQVPGTVYSMDGAQLQNVSEHNTRAPDNYAWIASADNRGQNHF